VKGEFALFKKNICLAMKERISGNISLELKGLAWFTEAGGRTERTGRSSLRAEWQEKALQDSISYQFRLHFHCHL
jgi:hypothetical protein